MALGIVIGIVVIFIGSILVYGAFMVFWPEWVGITGKTARDYEKSHQEGTDVQENYDLIDRLQKNEKH